MYRWDSGFDDGVLLNHVKGTRRASLLLRICYWQKYIILLMKAPEQFFPSSSSFHVLQTVVIMWAFILLTFGRKKNVYEHIYSFQVLWLEITWQQTLLYGPKRFYIIMQIVRSKIQTKCIRICFCRVHNWVWLSQHLHVWPYLFL